MGFVLSLLYIALAILSPEAVLPSLAEHHLQIWIASAAVIASLSVSFRRAVWSVPQAKVLLVVIASVFASFVAIGWVGGGIRALRLFSPDAIVFFFILINCRDLRRLRIVATVLVLISLYLVIAGSIAYSTHDPNSPLIFVQRLSEDTPDWVPRMRAVGFLNDPNDLAQFLITVLPFLWLTWRPSRWIRNVFLTLLPACLLVTGIFLTHSRGGMIALAAVLLFMFKDKLGTPVSVLIAGTGLALATAIGFSGGRDISIQAGTDRIDAWGAGLQMLRSSPLFGVGYMQFAENFEIPAHNSFIHAAAELGVFGYFFWMALLVFSISDLTSIIHSKGTSSGYATREDLHSVPETELAEPVASESQPECDQGLRSMRREVQRWATALRISFVGYLAAAFFLSRSYTITLFLLVGMAAVLLTIATDKAEIGPLLSYGRLLRRTSIFTVISLLCIYMVVRVRWQG